MPLTFHVVILKPMVAIAGDAEASYFSPATAEIPQSVCTHRVLCLSLRHVDGRGRECHFLGLDVQSRLPVTSYHVGRKFLRSAQKLPHVVCEHHLIPDALHNIS